MREIKFEICIRRKDGSDMFYDILTLDELLNRNGCLYNINISEIVYKRQFTGLLDSQGKEIYEGDILNNNEYFFENGIVKYRNNKFEIMIYENAYLDGDDWWELSEIIGNIYENPELKEAK